MRSRLEWIVRRWVAPRTVLYRPQFIDGFNYYKEGPWGGPPVWMASYSMGPLRARVCGIPIPVEWAFENMVVCGVVKPPSA
jgi:hypothetical protein